jgi:hypothetical protein
MWQNAGHDSETLMFILCTPSPWMNEMQSITVPSCWAFARIGEKLEVNCGQGVATVPLYQ